MKLSEFARNCRKNLGQFADLKLSRLAVCNKSPLVALIYLTPETRAAARRESQPNPTTFLLRELRHVSQTIFCQT
jgi:hypothetical protein